MKKIKRQCRQKIFTFSLLFIIKKLILHFFFNEKRNYNIILIIQNVFKMPES